MHFFTEPSKIDNQSPGQEFGAIDENQYRLGNMFSSSATEDPKAFAITDGLILVQKITGVDKYNIILKPTQQPDLNLPKIDYIIYKGIKKDSIIEGTKVADENKNDLTKSIHGSAQLWYENQEEEMPNTEPAADTSLGLIYDANATDANYQLQDSDSLNEAFYSNNPVTLPFVLAGNHIGDFDSSSDFGIVVIFEKIGFQPTFQLARELESVLEFPALGSSPTNAEVFQRKNEKEDILAFIDAAAFFGAFFNLELNVYEAGSFTKKSEASLYNDVITKFFNKNKLYIDIRNEYNDSFNYYENYNNTIQWSLDNTTALINVDYYRNDGWPILVIDDGTATSEFSSSNTEKVIKLAISSGNNEEPIVYYKRAFKKDTGLELPKGSEMFDAPVPGSNIPIKDIINPISANRAIATYQQIKLIEKINDSQTSGQLNPHKESYLDALFPISEISIPFNETTGKSYLKLNYDSNFADKTGINSSNFTSVLGMAEDVSYIYFIAFPSHYNLNLRFNIDDKLPLSSLEGPIGSFFINQLDNLIESVKLVQSSFFIDGVEYPYLKFIESNEDFSENQTKQEKYTLKDLFVLSFTLLQYQDLVALQQAEFPIWSKVYLSIENIHNDIDDNGVPYSKFECKLVGLKEDGSGNIISHNASSSQPIVFYTEEKIIGSEYERNYEEKMGYDNYQSPETRYEDYFIGLQPSVQLVVEDFIEELNNLDTTTIHTFDIISSLVKAKAKELWTTAVSTVQSSPSNPDDRSLYWARIKMEVAIKKHPYFLGDLDANSKVIPDSELDQIILLFEEQSRNYTGVDFSGAPPGAKRILIAGFDPFQLNLDIETQNPSGISSLQLHGKTITDSFGNTGYIQTAIYPVRYFDFDKNVVENLITGYLQSNSIEMILSLSLNGGNYYFDLERFAGKNRGGFKDNLNIGSASSLFIQLTGGNEFYETTLPVSDIITSVVANNFNLNGQTIFYDQSYTAKNGNSRPHVTDNPSEPNTNTDSFPFSEITENSVSGSGGNYLSNEIFYRIARARENNSSSVKTGHYHVANQNTPQWDLLSVLGEVENALKRSLNAL